MRTYCRSAELPSVRLLSFAIDSDTLCVEKDNTSLPLVIIDSESLLIKRTAAGSGGEVKRRGQGIMLAAHNSAML